MVIKLNRESEKIQIDIEHTRAELHAAMSDSVKFEILLTLENLIKETVGDLYGILTKEEKE